MFVTFAVCFVCDAKPDFLTIGIRATFMISRLYNMRLSFRIKENRYLDLSKFCCNFSA